MNADFDLSVICKGQPTSHNTLLTLVLDSMPFYVILSSPIAMQ